MHIININTHLPKELKNWCVQEFDAILFNELELVIRNSYPKKQYTKLNDVLYREPSRIMDNARTVGWFDMNDFAAIKFNKNLA